MITWAGVGAAGLERLWVWVSYYIMVQGLFLSCQRCEWNNLTYILVLFFSLYHLTVLFEFQHNQQNKKEMIRQWVFRFWYIVKNNFYFQVLDVFSFTNGICWAGETKDRKCFIIYSKGGGLITIQMYTQVKV